VAVTPATLGPANIAITTIGSKPRKFSAVPGNPSKPTTATTPAQEMAKASTKYVDTPVRDALAAGPLCNGSGVDMGASKCESPV
jgi:hypothetical protein